MERIKLKTKDIVVMDNDYKYSSHLMFEKLKRSLSAYGQLRPINCIKQDEKYLCFEGKFILKAMLECKIEEVDVNVHNFNSTEYSNLQLIMNDLYFKKCDIKTAEILSNLKPIDYSMLPFQKEEIDSYIKLLTFDWIEFERKKESLVQISMFDIIEEEENKECFIEESSVEDVVIPKETVSETIEQVPEQVVEQVIELPKENETQETKIVSSVSEEVKVETETIILNPFHVYIDENNNLKIIPEDKLNESNHLSIYRGTFSNCRLFINQNEKQNEN